MARLTWRPLVAIVATAALVLTVLIPGPPALAADIKIKGVNDSYSLEVGSKTEQQVVITISPSLEDPPEIRTNITLKAALDNKIPQLEITSGKELTYAYSNFNVPQNITVTMRGNIAAGLSTTLTLSGFGIETKTTTIKTVAPSEVNTNQFEGATATATLDTANTAPDSASPCYDGTTGPLRDCTLGERIADKSGFVYIAWQSTRVIINLILILALLVISFSNILRINIDTYTVKKALPNLVIGVILANASFLIIRYMADISTVAVYLFVNQTSYSSFKDFVSGILSLVGMDVLKNIGPLLGLNLVLAPIVVLLLGVIVIIGLLWLAFLLYFRLVAVYLLTILAPIAFVSYGLPGFEKYFKQWWQQFVKWLFILPAMSAVFWVMYAVATAGAGEQSIAKTIIEFFLFFTALALPSKMGGAVIDKASQAFKKYSGSDAATKWAGEQAKGLGRDAGSRLGSLTGITRLQEWSKLRKENLENAIKNRQTFAAGRARRGLAGRSEARLGNEGVIAADELAEIKAGNEERYFESPRGKEQLKRAIEGEIKKRAAEAERDNTRLEIKIDYTGDKANEELMKRLYKGLFDQKRASDELELSENIAIGDEAFSRIQILRAAEEYGSISKKEKAIEERLKDTSIDAGERTSLEADLAALKIDKESQRQSFIGLQKLDKEFQGKDSNGKDWDIETVASAIKNKDSTNGRLWSATLGRGGKIVAEGIAKQNEQTLKEGSATDIDEMMQGFLKSIDEDFGAGSDSAKRMKDLFFRGKHAEFQLELDKLKASLPKDKKVNTNFRDGLLATQAQKWVMAKPNDYRNEEVLQSIIEQQKNVIDPNNRVTFTDDKGYAVEAAKLDLSDQNTRKRAARAVAKQSGAHAGPENKRVQQSFQKQKGAAKTRPPEPERRNVTNADIEAAGPQPAGTPRPQTQEEYDAEYEAAHGITPDEWRRQFGQRQQRGRNRSNRQNRRQAEEEYDDDEETI